MNHKLSGKEWLMIAGWLFATLGFVFLFFLSLRILPSDPYAGCLTAIALIMGVPLVLSWLDILFGFIDRWDVGEIWSEDIDGNR